MQNWMIWAAIILLCRAASHILRRFKAGSYVILILSKLYWLFTLWILGTLIDNDVLRQFHYFFFLIFLNTPVHVFVQSIFQIHGDIFVNMTKAKAAKDYVQKGEYILPFTGKWTVFNGGINEKLQHGGSASQKYAYDFIIVDDAGKSHAGNKRDVQSYYCYGKDIIAPAGGTVVKAVKRYKDSYADGINAYCDAPDLRGNYIVIKHHDNEYSLIAHLMRNSVKVNAGDKVAQGEVIAKCGNTGNTSEPHIHFQLQTGKSFFFSAGLPIAFSNITAQAKENYSLLDTRPCENNLQSEGGKTYIGRGLEAGNRMG